MGDGLGDGGLVPLPAGRIALEHQHLAARVEPHRRCAVAGLVLHRHEQLGGDPGELDPEAEADPEIAALRPRLGLAGAEARQVGLCHQVVPQP